MTEVRVGVVSGLMWVCATVGMAEPLARFVPGEDISASAPIVPSVDGRRGVSGYSFVAEFVCTNAYSGPVVTKPDVFSLEISGAPDNRLYVFRLFGESLVDPSLNGVATLAVNAESDPLGPVRVAGTVTYYSQPEQSRVGYLLSLYVDGALVGSRSYNSFVPNNRTCKPIVLAQAVDVRSVELDDRARSIADLFPQVGGRDGRFGRWDAPETVAWRQAQKDVRFLETTGLVMAVAERPVSGNPVLGAWNRLTGDALLVEDGLGWELEYGGEDGVPRRMRSGSRRIRSCVEFRQNGFVVTSTGAGFTVRHGVRLDGNRIERRLEADDARGCRIRGAVFPKARLAKLPGDDTLVEPQFCGVIARNPTISYQMRSQYPEDRATMQFVGYYDDRGNGVYFGAEDPKCLTKSYMSSGVNGQLTLEYFVSAPREAGRPGARRFRSSGQGVLETYRGGWFEAGQVYRKFLKSSAPWYAKSLPRADTPTWFMKNPLWIVNLNLTQGRKPAVRYLCDYFDVPTAFVTGVVTPADGHGGYGPNYALVDEACDSIRELQAEGVRFLAYTNPRLWYAGRHAEKSNGFSKTGKLWAVKDERGVAPIEHFGPDEDYVDPCPAVPEWRDFLCRRTRRVARDAHLDGIYHDQLICATPHVCFDPSHGHRVGDPASWTSGGIWKFCNYLMGDLRKEMPELVHTSEETAEPCVNRLDGFLGWRAGRSGHVPLFQSLYSPRVQFVGRGCDFHRVPGSYESFFPKYAEQLAYGEQIGWTHYLTVSYPSPRRGFLKKLAHCRWALADFLNSAEMEAPLAFAEPVPTLSTEWGVCEPNPVTVDKVLHSTWRHVDGRRLAMFLNVTDAPQDVTPVWTRGGKAFAICRETSDAPVAASTAPTRVKLPPYGFEFWFVGDGPSPEAVPLATRLAKAARFWADDRGAMLAQKPAFERTSQIDATGGRPVTPHQAAWGLLAYIPQGSQFDNSDVRPEEKDGWIAMMDGGLVNYGTVDFGTGARSLELSLATDQPGVRVEFFDITGDVPERKIAAFDPEAGGWHDYRAVVSPLFGELRGKRDVVCRVTGGTCNLKNWRLLETGRRKPERIAAKDAPGKTDFGTRRAFGQGVEIRAQDAAWTLFARRSAKGLELSCGSYASYGQIDFGKGATQIEIDVAAADAETVFEVMDVSEMAPSIPLTRIQAVAGKVSAPLSFKVEGVRDIVLMVKGGSCTLRNWRVVSDSSVSADEMRSIYEEVKTPYKYGVILAPEEGKMLDNPNVFRQGDSWYMLYIVFDQRGYETRLAKSDDLLHWRPLGPALLRGMDGTWDCAQADGGPALLDVRWDGPNTLGTRDGRYWMTYIGGAKAGYETDPLAIGLAVTDDPSAAKLWTRIGDCPALAPWDKSARWFEDVTLYKSFVMEDETKRLGKRYVMYYNAKTGGVPGSPKPWLESIGMAVSDDLRTWTRHGSEPVILNRDGADKAALSADPMIRRIGDKYVMFYFGYQWGPFAEHAGETFAVSRDLVHWTKWDGAPLVFPSEPWDRVHAHKPWVIKHAGVVYHFYCAVGDRGRVLALATSKEMR